MRCPGWLKRRPTRRCTVLLIAWSSLAIVLLYLRASRHNNRAKMADTHISADLMNSYFHWPILDLVQRARIFPDGKQFVDMMLKRPLNEIVSDFERRGLSAKSSIAEIAKFVEDNYLPAGSDVEPALPPDWSADAVEALAESTATRAGEPGMADWVRSLHQLWRPLSRRPVLQAVTAAPRLSSLVLPSGIGPESWFIVPGGRFRELYYWDSYWTLRGLAVSGMHASMRSMLVTMLGFVAQLGYMPNCNRVYCLNRSQPPMLCLMVEAYLNATNDEAFLRENFHLLEREYDWWMSERTATVLVEYKYSYALNHYGSDATRPRPESYREDWLTAHGGDTGGDETDRVFAELTAACESGADFSSRWLARPASLASAETSRILPADLNAILYKNERLLSGWASRLGRRDRAHLYADSADMRLAAIRRVLWNETAGCWLDWHQDRQASVSDRFYASNLVPLFAGAVHDPETTVPRVLDYLERSGALAYPAGVPYSLGNESGQQWDFPNVWPPYQHMLVTGLAGQSSSRARQLARRLAGDWLRGAYAAWRDSATNSQDRVMQEKADCRTTGRAGSGGEYASQVGFGWTIGTALDLLAQGLL